VVHLTPAMAQLLDETARDSIPSVRRVFFGGDLLHMRDVDRAKKLMPHAKIVNFYNSSETQRGGGFIVFSNHRTDTDKEVPPLGRGISDVQLVILNQAGQLSGIGELGEICIRSPHMARGYLGDETLTKERFITNPFTGLADDRIYRTGELGRYLPDGSVEFVARGENQVSIRGFRVDLGEIESALKSHSGVSNAVVSFHEHLRERLIAHLVATPAFQLSIDELRAFLRARLPSYMIPVTFIVCESLPLLPTGKVDRKAVLALEVERVDQASNFVAPRNPVEASLGEIWRNVLGLNKIDVHDNFFDLGGHSLLATRIMSHASQAFQLELPVKALFDAPTIAQLGAAITEKQAARLSEANLVQILSEVERMTEEEAQKRLSETNA
jgi:acyl-CoA synthetase (AMP-forming)/AMP-acid ligase II/acyl carrier protein